VVGELVLDSKPDSGTTVVAAVPLQEARPLTERTRVRCQVTR
jgi:hypothetical protein